jgi:hypothetical protein
MLFIVLIFSVFGILVSTKKLRQFSLCKTVHIPDDGRQLAEEHGNV